MTDSADLERRYRRLLACYPRAFRREHEQEILAVLMAGADERQQRPRLGEAADLIKHALWMRLGLSQGGIMGSTTTFPISFDRPSRAPMTVLGAGPKVSRVEVSSSTVDIRMGWAFHATIPREAVASARPTGRRPDRTEWSLPNQRSPRSQLLARHRARQWRRYRTGRDHVGSVEVGAARSASGPDAATHRECRGPNRARRGTQPEHPTLARSGGPTSVVARPVDSADSAKRRSASAECWHRSERSRLTVQRASRSTSTDRA
jgi:hypothetical protein